MSSPHAFVKRELGVLIIAPHRRYTTIYREGGVPLSLSLSLSLFLSPRSVFLPARWCVSLLFRFMTRHLTQ